MDTVEGPYNDKIVKLEGEVNRLRGTIQRINLRLGDEIISDGEHDEAEIVSEIEISRPRVNTEHYDLDSRFASKYYFITNVS